jgi:hypothetical protein
VRVVTHLSAALRGPRERLVGRARTRATALSSWHATIFAQSPAYVRAQSRSTIASTRSHGVGASPSGTSGETYPAASRTANARARVSAAELCAIWARHAQYACIAVSRAAASSPAAGARAIGVFPSSAASESPARHLPNAIEGSFVSSFTVTSSVRVPPSYAKTACTV